jgi:peptide chain release factor subunit 1
VPNRVAVGHSPLVGPLARIARRERWCVTLVNRRDARILRGGPDGLREVQRIHDDVSGQHDQGGWSQSRYQRGVEKEKDDHLKATCDALLGHFKRQPFERLLVGGPREVVTDFEHKLHHYLSERLAGRIEVDVEHSSPDQVLDAARPLIQKLEHERERDALERLGERGACGIEEVLPPLNERRVELLILDEQFGGVTGVQCLECGWLGLEGDHCPADGSELVKLEDLTEAMIELSVQQAADLLAVHHEREALERYGGAATLLRF